MLRWDIFCKVIDNYGDIGVSWRLARQLSDEYGQNVRLWVDRISTLAAIEPRVDPNLDLQTVNAITVMQWSDDFDWTRVVVGDVVVEAFACTLPKLYINNMLIKKSMTGETTHWFNLEYLTAEAWVDGCHLASSPQMDGLNKTFFFPGFSSQTGGLLREKDLLERYKTLDKTKSWHTLTGFEAQDDALKMTLFGYQRMPLKDWLPCLVNSDRPIQLAVTSGHAALAIRNAWQALNYVDHGQQGALSIRFIPMLTQSRYDELLWSSDLNCVRGEDSWVRAIWAGVPFVWHIYAQDDGAHWNKLHAFIERYFETGDPAARLAWGNWLRRWNGDTQLNTADVWAELLRYWPQIYQHAQEQSIRYAQIEGLAQQLLQRCGIYEQNPL